MAQASGTAMWPGGGSSGSSMLPNMSAPWTSGGGSSSWGMPGQNQFTPFYGGNPSAYMGGNVAFPGYGGGYGGYSGYSGFGGYGGGSVWGDTSSTPYYNPYQIPQQGSAGGPQGSSGQPWSVNYTGTSQYPAGTGLSPNPGSEKIGSGLVATGLQYPGLSTDFAQYLQSQIGQGVQPYNLSTVLPTGGMTAPGQLTAGLNPLASQLANYYSGGYSSAPGANTLSTIANQGISALPEWQAMIGAQQQNINVGAADLKEQLGYMGNIAGSPMANAMSNYYTQSQAQQNALLGQLQQTNILQGQIPAATGLLGGANTMATGLQNLDQSAINAMLSEYNYTQPQNNPMLQYIGGLATLYPPTTKDPGFGQTFSQSLAGGLGSALGGLVGGTGYSSSTGPGGTTTTWGL